MTSKSPSPRRSAAQSSSNDESNDEIEDAMVSAIEQRLYRDHSHVTPEEVEKDPAVMALRRDRREGALFPLKLHQILSDHESEGVISWLPHGRAWKVLNSGRLEQEVLPKYFGHGRLASFMRQVNGWNFRRVTHGADKDAYYHEFFLRGMPYLCFRMNRSNKNKRERTLFSHLTGVTPDFYKISREHPLPIAGSHVDARHFSKSEPERDSDKSKEGSNMNNASDALNSGTEEPPAAPAPELTTSNVSAPVRALQDYIMRYSTEGSPATPSGNLGQGAGVLLQQLQDRNALINNLRGMLNGDSNVVRSSSAPVMRSSGMLSNQGAFGSLSDRGLVLRTRDSDLLQRPLATSLPLHPVSPVSNSLLAAQALQQYILRQTAMVERNRSTQQNAQIFLQRLQDRSRLIENLRSIARNDQRQESGPQPEAPRSSSFDDFARRDL